MTPWHPDWTNSGRRTTISWIRHGFDGGDAGEMIRYGAIRCRRLAIVASGPAWPRGGVSSHCAMTSLPPNPRSDHEAPRPTDSVSAWPHGGPSRRIRGHYGSAPDPPRPLNVGWIESNGPTPGRPRGVIARDRIPAPISAGGPIPHRPRMGPAEDRDPLPSSADGPPSGSRPPAAGSRRSGPGRRRAGDPHST